MKRKILFILSGNLSTTPRALKVINLIKEDFVCDIVLVNRSGVWFKKDEEIITALSLKPVVLNLGRQPFLPWFLATLKEKMSILFYFLSKKNIDISACAGNKSSIILWNYLKKQVWMNYSLILGFGAGSLYPCWKLSNKCKVLFAIDVEDFYPGEFIRKDAINERNRREFLMKQLLPHASLVTLSSPLISRKILELIGGHKNYLTVLNNFAEDEFTMPKTKEGPLKMIWFSQKITYGRGLEQLFEAMKETDYEISLTVIGDIDKEFERNICPEVKKKTVIKTALKQRDLHFELAEYDIGLALDLNNADENRQYCLTNKILAYSQAGLYILATDTPAQKLFIQEDAQRGMICGQNSESIATALKKLIEEKDDIRANALDRYKKAESLSWDNFSNKLKKMIEDLMEIK